jgi:hypothetical protein
MMVPDNEIFKKQYNIKRKIDKGNMLKTITISKGEWNNSLPIPG